MELPVAYAPEHDTGTIRKLLEQQGVVGFQKCAIKDRDGTFSSGLIVLHKDEVLFLLDRARKVPTADEAIDNCVKAFYDGSLRSWVSCYELIPGEVKWR